MQDKSDAQLLREYAEGGCEPAFREIVTRHTDLVYSAAFRCLNSSDLACDVAQDVFTDLSRKAAALACKLADNASIVGWLYRSTRFAALNQLRHERRRWRRISNLKFEIGDPKGQAMEQLLSNSESVPDWDRIRPVLDKAMDSLNDQDREALLLRYFKNHDFRAVGLALGVSDDAAQKRVSRAVERLREFLAERGVTTGAGGLTVLIAANAVQAAPFGLCITISTAALGGTTATKAIAMTTLQKALIAAALAVALTAPLYLQHRTIQNLRLENAGVRELLAAAARQAAPPSALIPTDVADIERLRREHNELLRLRGEVSRLHRQLAEAATKHPAPAPTEEAGESSEPVQVFVANAVATVPAGQTLAFGGWSTSPGKRTLVFVQPKILEPSSPGKLGTVFLAGRFIEVPDEVLARVTSELNLDVLENLKTAGKASSMRSLLTAEQASLAVQMFEKTTGVDVLSLPRIQTGDGVQATIGQTEQKMVAGQEHTLGSTLDVEPRIAVDGSSVNLTVSARLRKASPAQQDTP